MEYKCPNCGAAEGGLHYASCNLAGSEVTLRYGPPDFAKAKEWLGTNCAFLKEQTEDASTAYALINAVDLTYVLSFDFNKAVEAYKKRFGPTPPGGRHFLGQQIKFPA